VNDKTAVNFQIAGNVTVAVDVQSVHRTGGLVYLFIKHLVLFGFGIDLRVVRDSCADLRRSSNDSRDVELAGGQGVDGTHKRVVSVRCQIFRKNQAVVWQDSEAGFDDRGCDAGGKNGLNRDRCVAFHEQSVRRNVHDVAVRWRRRRAIIIPNRKDRTNGHAIRTREGDSDKLAGGVCDAVENQVIHFTA